MSKDFEKVLDGCIDSILTRGATVEDCLARYPEKAAELEGHLRLVIRTAASWSFTPSHAAKEKGRQRLQMVMRELEQQEHVVRSSVPARKRLLFCFRPIPVLAVLLVIVTLLVSGIGTVAASGTALPGELLYPVKRATEQVRLALELSQTGKAELHLAFAERRVDEAGELTERGDTRQLAPTIESLNESLAEASKTAGTIMDTPALENLRAQLENSATRALANLQMVMEKAPEERRSKTADSFQAINVAYGQVMEEVALRNRDRHAVSAPGIIQFWAIDPPPGVEKLLIEVGRIEAYLVAGPEPQWVTVVTEPQVFDLVRLAEVQKFLGEQKVKPGTYIRIKLEIIKAVVVSEGKEIEVKVPSNSLTLVRPFIIQEGKTTKVFLDFDGEKSLHTTGQGEFILNPIVRALVREPGSDEPKLEKEKPLKSEKPEKKPGESMEPEKPPVKVDLDGTIDYVAGTPTTSQDSVTRNSYVIIKGQSIVINSNTKVDQPLEKGERYKVEALVQPDGTLVATRVEVEKKAGENRKEAAAPTVTISGSIESIGSKEWIVAGHRIQVVPETAIKGRIDIGLIADVVGSLQPDGNIVATQISIKPGPTSDGEKKKEQPTPRPQEEDVKKLSTVHLEGAIESISPIRWIIKGREVLLSKDTRIEGAPAVGFKAEVEGVLQPDNKLLAISIKIPGSRLQPMPTEKPQKSQSKEEKKDKKSTASPTPKAGEKKTGHAQTPRISASPVPTARPPSKQSD